jgi:spore coat protein U-like protein
MIVRTCNRWRVIGVVTLMSCVSVAAHGAVSCGASASSVAFGIYDPLQGTPDTSTGNLTVTCSATGSSAFITVFVSLSTGLSGTYSARKMFSGANTLNYNLYGDNTYTQVWGDGTSGTVRGSASVLVAPGSPRTLTGTWYGRVPAAQDVAAGTYADTIVVTVTY